MFHRSSSRSTWNNIQLKSITTHSSTTYYLRTINNTPIQPSTRESQLAMTSQKVVLVTGANDGIGYEAVKALLESDKAKYHVFLSSRSLEKGKLAVEKLQKEVSKTSNTVELIQVDVTSSMLPVTSRSGRLSNKSRLIRVTSTRWSTTLELASTFNTSPVKCLSVTASTRPTTSTLPVQML